MKSGELTVLLNRGDSVKTTGIDNPRNIRENKMHLVLFGVEKEALGSSE